MLDSIHNIAELRLMKSKPSTRTILLVTALLFAIVTCYGNDDPSDLLLGKWTKSLNERTITFRILPDLKFQVDFAGDAEIDVFGSYVISGDQITFTDEGGAYSSEEPGVYRFEVNDNTLTFTPVDDPVYGRSILMEGAWSKSSKPEE